MRVRPATAADFLAFVGELPPYRVKAWLGEVDGRIVGISGVAYPANSVPVLWADLTDEARAYPVTLHRAALKFLATLNHSRLVASASSDVPAARRWLERFGFVATGHRTETGEVYIHDRDRHTH